MIKGILESCALGVLIFWVGALGVMLIDQATSRRGVCDIDPKVPHRQCSRCKNWRKR